MSTTIYQVDAFTTRAFAGNPAAVCPLNAGPWPSDALLQGVAMENNLSETAFFKPGQGGAGCYDLRWFTPAAEVDLCGHATLASSFVLWQCLGEEAEELRFETQSGQLRVSRRGDEMGLDFPSRPPHVCDVPGILGKALGAEPREVLASRDYLVLLDSEAQVRSLSPDMALLSGLELMGVMVTARAEDGDTDFVSRYFAPRVGIPEDPVTGSSHCTLIPYWAGRLGKERMKARQVSARGGELGCELLGDRVRIWGRAVLVMRGEMFVDLG